MVRDFNIEISITYGWELDVVGFKGPYSDYEGILEAPISFGICVKEDNKLMALYDPFCPKTEAIKEANELPIFLEECNFYDEFNDYKFKGTFVDALIYIQNKYIEYKLPTLEDIAKKKESKSNG
jgi:hypothetical protein